MSHVHHGIDYIEFCVEDLAAAKAFFAAAFGWAFNDYGDAYVGIKNPAGEEAGPPEIGGMRRAERAPADADGYPLVILYSEDLAASVASVEGAGGHIVDPPFEFPGGRRFHFRDPSGNLMAVWSSR